MLCIGTTNLLLWNREFITVNMTLPFDLPDRNVITSHFCTVFHICTNTHTHTSLSRPGPPHYRSFMITLRYTTLGSTPLDEWSARHRDLYLTTHNNRKKQDIHTPGRIRTTIPESKRPHTHALDHVVTGMGPYSILSILILSTYIITVYIRRSFNVFSLNVNLLCTYRLHERLGSPSGLFP